MTNVVNMEEYRQRKIIRLEIEWDELLARSQELTAKGKNVAAKALNEKAKTVRAKINKLRGPLQPKGETSIIPTTASPFVTNHTNPSYRRGIQLPVDHIDLTDVTIPVRHTDGSVTFIPDKPTTDDPTKKS